MEQIRLFRKRFFPDEIIELKDDLILSLSEKVLITKWNVLKPRDDIARGVSAYFFDLGVKVSKVYDAAGQLVYWYCDIVQTQINHADRTYTFTDLLIDVLIYPDGRVEVVDMDEFADMIEQEVLSRQASIDALRYTNHLLELIYSGHFSQLTHYVEDAEKAAACS